MILIFISKWQFILTLCFNKYVRCENWVKMKINPVKYQVASHSVGRCTPSVACAQKYPKVISLSEYKSRGLSFCGNTDRNKEQVVFIGAESDPWAKAGGVGTVMKDYRSFGSSSNQVEIIPYYGADNSKGSNPAPLKDENGNYIMNTNKGVVPLELVKTKKIQWGKETDSEIMLFRPKDDDKKLTYFVFVDDVSSMKKPYQNTYVYKTGAKQKTNGWNGDPYAKFSKAAIEFLPDVIEDKGNFNPATVVCSDAQSAYAVEYMAQKTLNEGTKDDYEGIKPTYVGHNLGPGYCGETSMKNMFVNLGATPEQIENIENDPVYKDNIKGDKYFEPFIKGAIDETNTASAVEIPLHWADKGYVKSFSVVAEEYAKSIAQNPQTAHNIHNMASKLYENGTFNGILNPLNDPAVDPTKPLMNERYNKTCEDVDGKRYEAFETYPLDCSYEDIRRIKNANKLKLLQRLSAKDTTIITGNKNRTANINPEADSCDEIIRSDLLDKIKEGKGDEVPLFVSWGRIDTQKGHDITLNAFEKFAKTKEGKNAILILGAGLDKSPESKKVFDKVQSMLNDPELKGRIVHIDGWAPAYAMSSAADAAIFSSRFEPCGLTDLEAMKYYCTPIVTNTQGLKQKNFDPRNEQEAQKATSYKTKHEYNLLKSQVNLILDAYLQNNDEAKEKLKEEFPSFVKKDENGAEYFDDSLFKGFAKTYSKFLQDKKEELENSPDFNGELPENWDDWDELSKDYNFKFDGFARTLKDGILVSEMSDAISASVKADKTVKEKIFNNLKNLNTGWNTNNNLHPDNKSSHDLYKSRHLDSDYTKPNEEDLLSKTDSEVSEIIEQGQTEDLTKRTTKYGLPALGAVLTFILGRLGKQISNENTKELTKTINELNEQVQKQEATIKKLKDEAVMAAKKYKKMAIIIGVVSAVGGALVAGLTTGLLLKKHYQKKNSKDTTDVVTIQPKTPTAPLIKPLSFNDFKTQVSDEKSA